MGISYYDMRIILWMFPSARHLCMIYKHPSRGQERLYVVSVDVPFRAVAPSSSSPHFFFGCPGDLAPFASNLFHRSEISSTPSVCSKLSPSFSPHDHPSVVSASRFTQPKFPARITSPSYYVSWSATRFRVAAQSRPQVLWCMCGARDELLAISVMREPNERPPAQHVFNFLRRSTFLILDCACRGEPLFKVRVFSRCVQMFVSSFV